MCIIWLHGEIEVHFNKTHNTRYLTRPFPIQITHSVEWLGKHLEVSLWGQRPGLILPAAIQSFLGKKMVKKLFYSSLCGSAEELLVAVKNYDEPLLLITCLNLLVFTSVNYSFWDAVQKPWSKYRSVLGSIYNQTTAAPVLSRNLLMWLIFISFHQLSEIENTSNTAVFSVMFTEFCAVNESKNYCSFAHMSCGSINCIANLVLASVQMQSCFSFRPLCLDIWLSIVQL